MSLQAVPLLRSFTSCSNSLSKLLLEALCYFFVSERVHSGASTRQPHPVTSHLPVSTKCIFFFFLFVLFISFLFSSLFYTRCLPGGHRSGPFVILNYGFCISNPPILECFLLIPQVCRGSSAAWL